MSFIRNLSIILISAFCLANVYPFFKAMDRLNFKLICESSSHGIPVLKYKSIKTGLHVILAKVKGPIVNGFLTIGTEAHDDDGLPHALEHLIFMGSEDYPYKGVLDLLANRCLAEGTNAWTAIDHTAYTVKTGGSEGFLNFLPIYLEHLLYPTLEDSTFLTEVYHMTGEAEDAGVVFSEMQARENTGSARTFLEIYRALYPGNSGYKSETAGIMENLRSSTTNEKIRAYHKAMYNPENLHVIITGQIEPEEVFNALNSIENKILSKGDDKGNNLRPWQTQTPPLEKSSDIEVLYPSDNEGTGLVRVGWRGPDVIKEREEYLALKIFLKYLSDSSVSPLKKAFVETNDPLASTLRDEIKMYPPSVAILTFYGVPKEKIALIKLLLKSTLEDVANESIPLDLDMIKSTIEKLILKEESYLETYPHYTLAQSIIVDLLYGNTCQDMITLLNKRQQLESLLLKSSSFWQTLCRRLLIDQSSVIVRGVPSIAEASRLQEVDRKRIEDRKANLGPMGLKDLELKLRQAEKANEIEAPKEVLSSVPIPSIKNLKWHSLNAFTNIKKKDLRDTSNFPIDVKRLNFKINVDQIDSNFVQLIAVMDTSSLTPSERDYLQLLLELLLESPVRRNDKLIPFEDVVKDLSADTIKVDTMNGLELNRNTFSFGPYFNNIVVNLKVEMSKYERGVECLRDILFNVVFDAQRIHVKANKLVNFIGGIKKSAGGILNIMFNDLVFKKDSNPNRGNALRQEKFLTQLLLNLELDSMSVIQKINNVYKKVTNADNLYIHIASNFKKLSQNIDATLPWLSFLPNLIDPIENFSLNTVLDSANRAAWDEGESYTGSITGMGSVESAYLLQVTDSISGESHPDLPALMVAISYLTQLEGPMWREIRGKGLTYRYGIDLEPKSATLTLRLAMAAQLSEAYMEAVRILKSYIDGTEPWNPLLFESGRSSLIYEIIEREADISDVVQQSLFSNYGGVEKNYNQMLLELISNVTIADMSLAASKYFAPLIDPSKSRAVVVCPTPDVDKLIRDLAKAGHNLERISIDTTAPFAQL